MARILFTTHGSSGDVFPCIAVGDALRARGHAVRFAVAPRWTALVQAHGFEVVVLPDDEEPFPEIAVSAMRLLLPMVRSAQPMQATIARMRRRTDALRVACRNIDLLITTSSQPTAPTAAESMQVPWITFALSPLVLPSAAYSPVPLPIPPPRRFQPYAYRFSWALGGIVLRIIADRPMNVLRRTYGLPPQRDVASVGSLSPRLTAVALSPAFWPRPSDWASFIQLTGFCFWDNAATWKMPPGLETFFDTNTPVIAISSGSMAPELTDMFTAFYHAGVAAIRRIGARALVIGAAPGVLPEPLPADVYALPFAPFSHVYPRCAAVIHHGGAGSVGQAVRAGKPMLIVPWGFDQFMLGQQAVECGIGQWLPRNRATVARITTSLTNLLGTPRYTQQAQRLGERVAHEDGVTTFCERIETVLRG